mmetsp:Transcript_2153/g.6224  ORF Transcript_2153/g.6224 Transcript_2153/m.6224 type:complete len:695 (+) Transcript_2153:75-2159(+)
MGRKEKMAKAAEAAMNAELNASTSDVLAEQASKDVRPAAMGKGEEKLFEKKLSKEEKKAILAQKKAEREAKKRAERGEPEPAPAAEDGSSEGGGMEGDGGDGGSKASQGFAPHAVNDSGRGFFEKTGSNVALRTTGNMDIRIGGLQLFAGKSELISNGVLQLVYGTKYGLVGRNGVGKTSLLRALSTGQIPLPPWLHIVHVEQEIVGGEETALEAVMRADKEREWLLAKEAELSARDDDPDDADVTLGEVYERLDLLDSDNAAARAATLLSGLGFDQSMQNKPTRAYSGGWRMRIALAQALFVMPDLLLLDEPTNHLDVHALTWLEHFLRSWERTVLIVSHDRGFLNSTTTKTIHLHRKRLWYYGGNYDTFVKVRAEHRAHQSAVSKIHDRKVSHIKQFISRFGQGHKKMAKQAQSRMKQLAKLQEEATDVDFDDPYLKLDFPSATNLPPPCISVTEVSFGYSIDGKPPEILYANLNFGVDMDSRVAVIGPNGAGKSTFLKLLDGSLNPVDGHVGRHAKLRLARFTQHHLEMMDLSMNPVEHMRSLDDDVTLEEARKYLARFGLTGDLALKPIEVLSGGQKSRLAFAELAFRQPHILLLDEPTNHLDLETIEALAMALNHFEGGVVFVSHDERLIELVADELWVVNRGEGGQPGTVTVFQGSFEEYRKMLEQEFEAGLAKGKTKGKAPGGNAST